jgi:hypothetical protein
MTQIFPSDIEAGKASGESPEELKTLIALRDGMPNDFLVIEQKNGPRIEGRQE